MALGIPDGYYWKKYLVFFMKKNLQNCFDDKANCRKN